MVFFEASIFSNHLDDWFPSVPPITGDVQHMLHEDFEVEKNLVAKIFTNECVVIFAFELLDPI